MRSPRAATSPSNRPAWLASPWHTAGLCALLVAPALLAFFHPSRAATAPNGPYVAGLLQLVSEGLVLLLTLAGLRPGAGVLDGLRPPGGRSVRAAVGVAAGVALLALVAWGLPWLGLSAAPGASAPDGAGVRVFWVGVVMAVAFAEEIVFRDYLLRQLEALGLGAVGAVLAQAVVFALAHASAGTGAALAGLTVGVVLGALARSRAGLFAAVIAHLVFDVAVVLWPGA